MDQISDPAELMRRMAIEFEMPMRLKSIANASRQGNWWGRAQDKRMQRSYALLYTRAALIKRGRFQPPYIITITRVGKRVMDDDNLAISAKAVRDGIAEELGIDDGDRSKCRWVYEQEIGKQYAVKIRIEQVMEVQK